MPKDTYNDIREDIRDIKENHLAHIEPDIVELKTNMARTMTNTEWLMKFQWLIIGIALTGLITTFLNETNRNSIK